MTSDDGLEAGFGGAFSTDFFQLSEEFTAEQHAYLAHTRGFVQEDVLPVTVGDLGYVDTDGFLFLTDRKSVMIISGGVNIYPQELENVLTLHPQVSTSPSSAYPTRRWGSR
jgi:fatty-acyl-CoA synthase